MFCRSVTLIVFCFSSLTIAAWNWIEEDFGGYVRWSFNCDFYGDVYWNNQVVDGNQNIVKLIEELEANREDCGWLCWANFNCYYYSHSQNVCRTMSLKKELLFSTNNENAGRSYITTPYLADGDTICGYIPSRIEALKMSTNREI